MLASRRFLYGSLLTLALAAATIGLLPGLGFGTPKNRPMNTINLESYSNPVADHYLVCARGKGHGVALRDVLGNSLAKVAGGILKVHNKPILDPMPDAGPYPRVCVNRFHEDAGMAIQGLEAGKQLYTFGRNYEDQQSGLVNKDAVKHGDELQSSIEQYGHFWRRGCTPTTTNYGGSAPPSGSDPENYFHRSQCNGRSDPDNIDIFTTVKNKTIDQSETGYVYSIKPQHIMYRQGYYGPDDHAWHSYTNFGLPATPLSVDHTNMMWSPPLAKGGLIVREQLKEGMLFHLSAVKWFSRSTWAKPPKVKPGQPKPKRHRNGTILFVYGYVCNNRKATCPNPGNRKAGWIVYSHTHSRRGGADAWVHVGPAPTRKKAQDSFNFSPSDPFTANADESGLTPEDTMNQLADVPADDEPSGPLEHWCDSCTATGGGSIGDGSSYQYLADVNGDGKSDAISYFADEGRLTVARGQTGGFGAERTWSTDFPVGSDHVLFGDVDGDGAADAVNVDRATGTWTVFLSNGKRFAAGEVWATGITGNLDETSVRDVTGDGRADAIDVQESGKIFVARSSGTGFARPDLWDADFGQDADQVLFGDVNGDGSADALAVNYGTGDWEVATSAGDSFASAQPWATGLAPGDGKAFAEDVDGDGRADAVMWDIMDGSWHIASSTGTSFSSGSSWLAGFGVEETAEFLGDVDGDGFADAVLSPQSGGEWMMAKSNGSAFNTYGRWGAGIDTASHKRILADADGDGKADFVTFSADGTWSVSTSDVNDFVAPQVWRSGFGVDSTNQFAARVTPDTKADAITFTKSSGEWSIAPAGSSGFDSPQSWGPNFGADSADQFVADVNGDHQADAATVSADGDWSVATTSTSDSTLGAASTWIHGFGASADARFLADANGDGNADAVTFTKATGEWWVALSDGSSFATPVRWRAAFGAGSYSQILTDVNGDGAADAVYYTPDTGNWYIAQSDGTKFADTQRLMAVAGSGSVDQMIADVNGDGLGDAVTYYGEFGDVYVNPDLTRDIDNSNSTSSVGFGSPTVALTSDQYVSHQAVADVNGDGTPDAIGVGSDGSSNQVRVALGNASGQFQFGEMGQYQDWFTMPSFYYTALFDDVNADGMADLVVLDNPSFQSGGSSINRWRVYLSDGTKFVPSSSNLWLSYNSQQGIQADYLADVNNDGRADAIIIDKMTSGGDGIVRVALNTGSGFATPTIWGDSRTADPHKFDYTFMFADMNGDGFKDFVSASRENDASPGLWRYWPSNGSSFTSRDDAIELQDDFGAESSGQMVADVTGDGVPDEINADSDGRWEVARSDNGDAETWIDGGLGPETPIDSGHQGTSYFASDLNGDHLADAIAYTPIDPSGGSWNVGLAFDHEPPRASITRGPSAGDVVKPDDVAFEFSSNVTDASYHCVIDGGTPVPCVSPYVPDALSDGTHTFTLFASDSHGNDDPTPPTVTFVVDSVPPTATITSGPSEGSQIVGATPTFGFSSESGAHFTCAIDAETAVPCRSPFTTSPQDDGTHTFAVSAIDKAGNVSAAATRSFSVSASADAPDTSISSGPSSPSGDLSPTFEFSGSAGSTAYQCRIGSEKWTTCRSPYTPKLVAGLDGSQTLYVRAIKNGVPDPTPASYSWIADTAGPSIAITSPSESQDFSSGSVEVEFTADVGAATTCQVDDDAAAPCTSGEPIQVSVSGEHTLTVVATDALGNAGSASVEFSVLTALSVNISAAPTTPSTDRAPHFEFSSNYADSYECDFVPEDDDENLQSCDASMTFDLTGAADGFYRLDVRPVVDGVVDADSTTFVYELDTTPPTFKVSAVPPSDGQLYNTYAFLTNDWQLDYVCKLDDGDWSTCYDGWAPQNDIAQGDHELVVQATDPAGNQSAEVHKLFTIGASVGPIVITSGPFNGGALTGGSRVATYKFYARGAAGYECKFADEDWAPCTSPYSTPAAPNAGSQVSFRTVDENGTPNSDPLNMSFYVYGPQAKIIQKNKYTGTDPEFELSADDPTATFECSIDSAGFAPCDADYLPTGIDPGFHQLEVEAIDSNGNPGLNVASTYFLNYTPTGVAPVITSGPTGTTTDSQPVFTYTYSGSDTVFCQVDETRYYISPCPTRIRTRKLANGPHTVRFWAQGTGAPSPLAERTFTVATGHDAPNTILDQPAPLRVAQGSRTKYKFHSDLPGVHFECTVNVYSDDQPIRDFDETTINYQPCDDGFVLDGGYRPYDWRNVIDVRAVNGDTPDPTPLRIIVVSDATVPQVSIVSAPTGTTRDEIPAFDFAVPDDDTATFECSIDGEDFTACSSPYQSSGLDDGDHSFSVRARDAVGNTSQAVATFTVDTGGSPVIDTTAPNTFVKLVSDTQQMGGAVTIHGASFDLSATEPATFQCSIDHAALEACESSWSTGYLADGAHQVEVVATDTAGNVDDTPATYDFKIDTTAPVVSIAYPADGSTITDPDVSVAVTANEPVQLFVCALDTPLSYFDLRVCPTDDPQFEDLAPGAHTISVYTVDVTGHAASAQTHFTYAPTGATLDTAIDSGPEDGSTLTADSTSFSFSSATSGATFECSLDSAAYSACTSPASYNGLQPGTHHFHVRAVSGSNTDPTPASRTFNVAAASASISGGSLSYSVNSAAGASSLSISQSGASISINDPGTEIAAGASCSSVDTHTVSCPSSTISQIDVTTASGDDQITVTAPIATNVDSGSGNDVITTDATDVIHGGPGNDTINPGPSADSVYGDDGDDTIDTLDGSVDTISCGDGTDSVRGDQSDTFAVPNTCETIKSAPETTITSGPADGSWVNTSSSDVSFGFEADEPGVTFECKVDSGSYSTCSSPNTLGALADGSHHFYVRALDAYGNADSSPATREFSLDNMASIASISSPADGGYVTSSSVTTSFVADDTDSGVDFVTCILRDEGTMAVLSIGWCAPPHATFTGLEEGHQYRFSIIVHDRAGNGSGISSVFTVDSTPPALSITSPADGQWINAGQAGSSHSVSATFSAGSDAVAVSCQLDNDTPDTSCASPKTFSGVSDGAHTLSITATDAAGNPSTVTRTFSVDTQLPWADIHLPTGSYNTDTPVASYTLMETPLSSEKCVIVPLSPSGANYEVPCAPGSPLPHLNDGMYLFATELVDLAGNYGGNSTLFTVDTSPPSLTVNSPTESQVLNAAAVGGSRNVDVDFTAGSESTSVTCKLDNGSVTSGCTSPKRFSGVLDGNHSVTITAADALGNAANVVRSFSVDATPPSVSVTAPSGTTNNPTPAASFTTTDASGIASRTCTVLPISPSGSAINVSCNSGAALPALGNGSFSYTVAATDGAGNTASATTNFTVDTVAPTLSVTAPTEGQTLNFNNVGAGRTVSVAFSAGADAQSKTCKLDNGAVDNVCNSPKAYGSVADGTHAVTIVATDAAGNANTVVRNFTVEATAPSVSITSPANGSTITNSSPALTYTATDASSHTETCLIDTGSFGTCTSTLGPLTVGTHSVSVKSTDASGNSTTATSNFTVRNTELRAIASLAVPSSTENLTTQGTVDWSHWGTTAATTWDHKSGGSQISNITGTTVSQTVTTPTRVTTNVAPTTSWSDGTSGTGQTTSTSGTATGITNTQSGIGRGFSFTVGNISNSEGVTLRLHVGVLDAQGILETYWSSNPSSIVSDSSLSNSSTTTPTNGIYQITARPPTASDTLNVRWTQNTNPSSQVSKVRLYSASTTAVAASRATAPSAVNLNVDTAPATLLDWAHWGGTGSTLPSTPLTPIGKSGATSISNATQENGGTISEATSSTNNVTTAYSWTGGDTTQTGTNVVNGITNSSTTGATDRGFSFTVPAQSAAMETLKLYVGATNTSSTAGQPAKLELFWGSSTIPVYVDVSPSIASSTANYVYTINLRHPTNATTLKVKWSTATTSASHKATLQSVVLGTN